MTRPAAQRAQQPLARVAAHLAHDKPITVCSTPAGISSYLLPDLDARVTDVSLEQGQVVVRWVDDRFGSITSIVQGGAVVEVACHEDESQRDTYRQVCAEVDAENRENALRAVSVAAGALLSEAGVEVTPVEDDTETDT